MKKLFLILPIIAIVFLTKCGKQIDEKLNFRDESQFNYQRGFVKGPWQGLVKDAPFVVPEEIPASPPKFSWAEKNDIPVENQGNCGSCWAFSTVENFEWASNIFLNNPISLSKQFVVSQRYSGCGGGDFAGDIEVDPGLPLEKDCPYKANNRRCKKGIPIALKADSAINIGHKNGHPSVEELKAAMMKYGPLSVDVCAGGDWDGAGPNTVIHGHNGCINHMVVIFSWDDSVGKKGAWGMRNSWGAKWANKGSAMIEYGSDNIARDAATILVKPLNQY